MNRPFGRWNRDPGGCRLEIIYDGSSCWAECHVHNFVGGVHGDTASADADAEAHERSVFEAHRQGGRLVRGRIE